MGFPIRKFSDQSLFAAPRNLSQRTTSFIASQRQGIHQIPLRHLIALIAKARVCPVPDRQIGDNALWREKTSFASNASGDPCGQPRIHDWLLEGTDFRTNQDRAPRPHGLARLVSPHPALDRMRFLFTMSDIEGAGPMRPASLLTTLPEDLRPAACAARASLERDRTDRISSETIRTRRTSPERFEPPPPRPRTWWSQTGSNRRPHACKARALPTELWPRLATASTDPSRRIGKAVFSPIRRFVHPRPNWWAWEDLNLRPHAYQARALTN